MKKGLCIYKLLIILLISTNVIMLNVVGTESSSDIIIYKNNYPSIWAVKEIEKAIEYNLTTEKVLSNYKKSITREEFCELVIKLYEELSNKKIVVTNNNIFKDTNNSEVLKAYSLGIVKGVSENTFNPSSNITREQIAVMFYNAIKAVDNSLIKDTYSIRFADDKEISKWAKIAISFISGKGIMQGVENNKINPKGFATNEQAIVLVKRIYEQFNNNKNEQNQLIYSKNNVENVIRNALRNVEEEINLEKYNIKKDDFSNLVQRIIKDDPLILYYNGCSYTYNPKDNSIISVTLNYQMPKETVLSHRNKVIAKAEQILAAEIKDEMSDYEKLKAIHDYLILNTAYDYNNYLHNTIPSTSYNMYGCLILGKAVCQGYAEAMKYFLDLLKIESKIVYGYGDGENHAWNMLQLDNDWYHIDVTWDDPVPDQIGKIRYKYFNVNDNIIAKDHIWDKSKYISCNGTKYNYYYYNDLYANNTFDFVDIFSREYENSKNEISIMVSDYFTNANSFFIRNILSELQYYKGYSYNIEDNLISVYLKD